MSGRGIALVFFIFVLLGGAMNSFFIIDQTQQALVLRFGKPVNIISEPGLKFKVPFIDSVETYDRRVLTLNAGSKTVILQDQDRLIVDAYLTYRIRDPLQFYQAVRGNSSIMNERLENMLETALREVMGREDLNTLLSPKRSAIMNNIRENVYRLASGQGMTSRANAKEDADDVDAPAVNPRAALGIEIVDVRVMRTDLPPETSSPIYERMASDRQKVAARFRAEGQKESQIIRSEADRERTILLADAERQSAVIRGEGDAEATRIFAESFGKDADFFEFYRALEAYRKSLKNDDTTMILSPTHEFLKHLEQ